MIHAQATRRPEKRQKPPRDSWDKADIVAKFLSSVVIAVIGILITWSIQRTQIQTNAAIATAQLEAAKAKALDEKRFQESQLTIQLVNHLISPNGTQRQIAIVALQHSVAPRVYESIVQVLAKSDEDQSVRTAAIKQLATSGSPQVSRTLRAIGSDPKRTPEERQLAAKATIQLAFTSANEDRTYTYLSSAVGEVSLESAAIHHGFFTQALISGINGEADLGSRGMITAQELALFLHQRVASATAGRQNPVFFATGPVDAVLFSSKADAAANRIVALVIGISRYNSPDLSSLLYAAEDATAMGATLRAKGAEVHLLTDATRQAVSAELTKIEQDSKGRTLIIYFSGHALSSERSGDAWLVADSSGANSSTWISLGEVKAAMIQSQAKITCVFVEGSVSSEITALR